MSTFRVGHTELDDAQGRWRLIAGTALPAPAPTRTTLVETPFIDGATAVKGGAQTGTVNLVLWVENRPNRRWATHDTVRHHIQLLAGVFDAARILTYVPDEGESQSVQILQTVVSEPVLKGFSGAELSVCLTTMPFWAGSRVTYSAPLTAGTVTLAEFAGGTAPLIDAQITVAGAASMLSLTDPVSGTGISVPGTITAGTSLSIAVSGRTVSLGGSSVDYDYPSAGFLRISPRIDAQGVSTYQLHVSAQNIDGATLKITGRRWYR